MHTKIKAAFDRGIAGIRKANAARSLAEEKDDVKRAAPKAAAEEPYVVEAEIGIGYDSNAHLAPSAGYSISPRAFFNQRLSRQDFSPAFLEGKTFHRSQCETFAHTHSS